MTSGRFSVGRGNVLLAADSRAREITGHVGETVDVEIVFERDMVFHRRLMATINDLAHAVGQTPEAMRAQLLVYCGLFNVVGDHNGNYVLAVNSLSRHSMRESELHHFWDDAKKHIIERVLPKITNETVRNRLHTSVTAFTTPCKVGVRVQARRWSASTKGGPTKDDAPHRGAPSRSGRSGLCNGRRRATDRR